MRLPPEVLTTSMRTHQRYLALQDAAGGSRRGSSRSPTPRPRTAARRSSPATSACCGRGCGTRASSGSRTASGRSRAACRPRRDGVPRRAGLAGPTGRAASGAGRAARAARSGRRPALGASERRCSPRPISSTGMVGEFPELQGVMGGHYARAQGETRGGRRRHRRALRAQGAGRPLPVGTGQRRRGARRQARQPRRLLRGRHQADRLEGPVRPAPRRARRDPARSSRTACGCRSGTAFGAALDGYGDRFAVGAPRADGRPTCCASSPTASRCTCAARACGTTWSAPCSRPARRTTSSACWPASTRSDAFLVTEDGRNLLTAYRRASNIVGIEEKKRQAALRRARPIAS